MQNLEVEFDVISPVWRSPIKTYRGITTGETTVNGKMCYKVPLNDTYWAWAVEKDRCRVVGGGQT